MNNEKPYIEHTYTVIEWKYNPNYGDDRICECGHPYYRHFDTYEQMYNCGCKYCGCFNFKEKINGFKEGDSCPSCKNGKFQLVKADNPDDVYPNGGRYEDYLECENCGNWI